MNAIAIIDNLDNILKNFWNLQETSTFENAILSLANSPLGLYQGIRYNTSKIVDLEFDKDLDCFVFNLNILKPQTDICYNFKVNDKIISEIYIDNEKYDINSFKYVSCALEATNEIQLRFDKDFDKKICLQYESILLYPKVKSELISTPFKTGQFVYFNGSVLKIYTHFDVKLYVAIDKKVSQQLSFLLYSDK